MAKVTPSEIPTSKAGADEEVGALTSNSQGDTIRVLVFGATGTGKTSLCNALTGKAKPTDSGAKGVTRKSHIYAEFQHEGRRISIVDTVGLHESVHGTVHPEKAVMQLVELLNNSREGFSLLIHAAWAGRITDQHDQDYKFFVEKLTQNQIPVILAVTGCENEHPMFSWVQKNHAEFGRFDYKEIVATCFASGGRLEEVFAPLRNHSRQDLLRAVAQHALPVPHRLYAEGSAESFSNVLTRVWNEVIELLNLPKEYRRKTNESAYQLLKRIGVTEKVARAAVTHIPELLREVGDRAPVPFLGHVLEKVGEVIAERVTGLKRSRK